MTPQQIIQHARVILSDTGALGFRQTDPEMLGYVNLALREASVLRPDLFMAVGSMSCVPNRVEQGITFLDAAKFLEVVRISGGPSLTQFSLAAMNAFRPGWRTDPPGPAQQWAAFPGHPLLFFIYPQAPANQVLDVTFVRNPGTYALAETITDLPSGFMPALVWGVVSMAESKDDEHVLTQRAALAKQRFVEGLQSGVAT